MSQISIIGNAAVSRYSICSGTPGPFLTFLHMKRRVCLNVKNSSPMRCVTSRSPRANVHEAGVVDAAWEILDNYNKNDVKGENQPSLQSRDGLFALAASVVIAVEAAIAQDGRKPLLGICASDAGEAIKALRQWATVLGCEFLMPQILDSEHDLKTKPGPVYVKYNPQSQVSYLQSYNGTFRGVIAQIGNKQVGHLPLSLFNQEPLWLDAASNYGGLEQE